MNSKKFRFQPGKHEDTFLQAQRHLIEGTTVSFNAGSITHDIFNMAESFNKTEIIWQ